MAARTVRLDDDAEKTLARLRKITGLSISEVLKRGLKAYEQLASSESSVRAYDVYAKLELGTGGWAIAPAREAKRAVRQAIGRKHRR